MCVHLLEHTCHKGILLTLCLCHHALEAFVYACVILALGTAVEHLPVAFLRKTHITCLCRIGTLGYEHILDDIALARLTCIVLHLLHL